MNQEAPRQYTEAELIELARGHNGQSREAAGVLFSRYRGRAMMLVDRWRGPEDIVQDACLAAWQALPSFDSSVGTFGGWLYGILRHKFLDYCREADKLPLTAPIEYADTGGAVPRDVRPFVELSSWDFWLTIRDAIQLLPEGQCCAVEARIIAGSTYAQIAEDYGIGYKTAYQNAQLGLKKLRESLLERPQVLELLDNLSRRKSRTAIEGLVTSVGHGD